MNVDKAVTIRISTNIRMKANKEPAVFLHARPTTNTWGCSFDNTVNIGLHMSKTDFCNQSFFLYNRSCNAVRDIANGVLGRVLETEKVAQICCHIVYKLG
jgi:hypothetical protein